MDEELASIDPAEAAAQQEQLKEALATRDKKLAELAQQHGFTIVLGQGENAATYYFIPMGKQGSGFEERDILLTARASSQEIYETLLLKQDSLRDLPFSALSHTWPDARPNEDTRGLVGRIHTHTDNEAKVRGITPVSPENVIATFQRMTEHIKSLRDPVTDQLTQVTNVNDILSQI